MILIPLTSRQGISGVALMTSSGSSVATSPRRPITASPARRSGRSASQRSFPDSRARLPRRLPQPSLLGVHRLLWSQIHFFSADVLVSWLERAPCDDIDLDAQQFLEVLEQADMSRRDVPGSKSTSRSRSLSGRASPRATDPKTAIRCTLRLPATRRISGGVGEAPLASGRQRSSPSASPRSLVKMDQRRYVGVALSVRFSGGFADTRRSIAGR
jgi:hypothetical protein